MWLTVQQPMYANDGTSAAVPAAPVTSGPIIPSYINDAQRGDIFLSYFNVTNI